MNTIVSNVVPTLCAAPHSPVRAVTCTTFLTLRSNLKSLFSFSNSRSQSKSSRLQQGRERSFAVPKFTISCGTGITEINQSQFSEAVLKSDRPVLVEFVATWCGPCRLISPAMEWVAQEYGDKLTVVKIDHDANPQLIEEYKVYGLPTLILFKNGKEVPESRREGAITKVKLKEYVDTLLESISVA